MNEAKMSRRLFLEGTVAGGALLSLGSSLACGRRRRRASPRPARSAISRSRWPNGRSTRHSSPRRSTTSISPRSPARSTGSRGSSSSTSFSRTRRTTRTYLKDLKKRAERPRRHLRPDHDRRRGRLERRNSRTKRGRGRGEPQEVGRCRGGARLPRDPRQHRAATIARPTWARSPRPAAC